MPTRNVNLTDELALRALEREDEAHLAKLSALRKAIDEGDASGVAEDNVFTRVREKLKIPSSRP